MPVYAKARYWMLTIRHQDFTPYLPPDVIYIKGQLERGEGAGNEEPGSVVESSTNTESEEVGFLHWQVLVVFANQVRLQSVRRIFGDAHAEPSRSEAANEYVWKDETSITNTRFELGKRPFKRNSETDWDRVYELARSGDIEHTDIPADVRVRNYHSLRAIAKDYCKPKARTIQEVNVFWGVTGAGKSHRAFEEAGQDFYLKSSSTKWWDGYRGESNIVMDEFTGVIGIQHMLTWLDRYPCACEIKGGQVPLKSAKWWIMSNIPPTEWYNDDKATKEQQAALMRRLTNIVHYAIPFNQ